MTKELTRSVRRRINRACDEYEDVWLSGEQPEIASFLIDELEFDALKDQFAALLELEIFYRKEKRLELDFETLLAGHPRFESVIKRKMLQLQENSTETFPSEMLETSVSPGVPADQHAEFHDIVPDKKFGRYTIIRTLGKGGMGTVYLAEDTLLHRQVALKVPRFPTGNTELMERFRREAKAAAVIQHRNICPVFDIGTENGQLYITMSYIEGTPLSEFINPVQIPDQHSVARTIRKLALALDEAHRLGIVHRDLKPANVMIDQKGEPVLMDFGLARQDSISKQDQLTQSGMIVGTPAYMSPEQVRDSGKAGPAADIYSLGIIMYQLLTCELPFTGDLVSIVTKIMMEQPPEPSTINSSIDSRLESICLKAIEKDPKDRFSSMEDFANELKSFIRNAATRRFDGSGSHGRKPGGPDSTTGPVLENVEETFEYDDRERPWEPSVNKVENVVVTNENLNWKSVKPSNRENQEQLSGESPINESSVSESPIEKTTAKPAFKKSNTQSDRQTSFRRRAMWGTILAVASIGLLILLASGIFSPQTTPTADPELAQLMDDGARLYTADRVRLPANGDQRLVVFADLAENILPNDHQLGVVLSLPKLERLDVKYANLTPNGLRRLASSSLKSILFKPELSPGFDFSMSRTKDISVAQLQEIGRANQLVSLKLNNCGVNDSSLKQLEQLRNLRILDLRDNPITVSGLEHLKGMTNLEQLFIDLDSDVSNYVQVFKHHNLLRINPDLENELPLAEAAALFDLVDAGTRLFAADDAHLSAVDGKLKVIDGNLRELTKSDNLIDGLNQIVIVDCAKGISPSDKQLATVLALPRLLHLELNLENITLNGLESLATSNVTSVSVIPGKPFKARSGDLVFPKSLTEGQLQKIGLAQQLVTLGISNCGVTDEKIQHLTELRNLKSLDLRNNPIRGAGLKYLKNLPQLAVLNIDAEKIEQRYLDDLGSGVKTSKAAK